MFASQNTGSVAVFVIAGGPLELPLIAVIAISFFAGFAAAILGVIQKAIRRKKRKDVVVMDPRFGP